MWKNVLQKWHQYRYRFLPWLVFNLKDRTTRSVSRGEEDKLIPDKEVNRILVEFFTALESNGSTAERTTGSGTCRENHQVMRRHLGFSTERRKSSLSSVGTGVFVTDGYVPKHMVTSMYPGTIYLQADPLLFQSIGNPFIFRCIDGVLIDGNDKNLSKFLYSGRDRIGPYHVCDMSWLTPDLLNPLAVGQYVNNRSHDIPANVAYQEFDIPDDFPFHLRKYIPNVFYRPLQNDTSTDSVENRLVRIVVLVSVRPIQAGEELFSSYFTVVH